MYPDYAQQPLPPVYQGAERQQHLADLVQQLPNCRPINRDQSVFEVPARLRDGRTTSLRITLPPSFPQARPLFAVSHPIQHPWVDQAGHMSFPTLNQWGSHSRLSSVVQEALAALSGQQYSPPATSRPVTPDLSPTKAATAPTDFPELQTLSTEQLAGLLTSKDAFRDLLASHCDKSQPAQVKKLLARGNLDLAQANLERESELAELKNQIAIIRSSEYAAAKEAFEDKYARQQAVVEKIKPQALIAALAKKASEAEEASEALVEKFMSKELPVEGFVGQYVAIKKQYHSRELKRQAAQQIL